MWKEAVVAYVRYSSLGGMSKTMKSIRIDDDPVDIQTWHLPDIRHDGTT